MASHYFQILPLYMYLYANILYCCHDLVSHFTWWSSISVFLLAPAEQMAVGETTACTETSDSKWLAITDFSFRIIWFQVSPAQGVLLKSPSAQDMFHAVPGLWPAAVSHCNAACFYCIVTNAKREIELKKSGCISDRTVCELEQLLYADDYRRSGDAHTFNWLYAIDAYWCHTTFSLWRHFRQCPWDLGSAPAERVGQGEVGRFQPWAQVTWLLLGLAVQSPWSSPGGPFLSSCARTGLENSLLAM